MIWLLSLEVLIGMLLVAAVLRSRAAGRELAPPEMVDMAAQSSESRGGIHLVPSRPASAAVELPNTKAPAPGFLAVCVVFLMRQFAIHILRAEWRPRRVPVTAFTHPYAGHIPQSRRWPV
jgi:hypothetical protein